MKYLNLCFLFFLTSCSGGSATLNAGFAVFQGQAVSPDPEKAKALALSDLQQNIYVKVETETINSMDNFGKDVFSFESKVSSSIPILGSASDCKQIAGEYQCLVTLDGKLSAPMYLSAFADAVKTINRLGNKLEDLEANAARYKALNKLLKAVQTAEQLKIVLSVLAPGNEQVSEHITKLDVRNMLSEMEATKVDEFAVVQIITEAYKKYKHILIKPFTPQFSHEVTPLASRLHNSLSAGLTNVEHSENARYVLQGQYRESNETIQIETQLVDLQGNIIDAKLALLDTASLVESDYISQQIDFEKLLMAGQLVEDDYKAKIFTNRGHRNLIFKFGSEVSLYAKVNKPSYLYMIGHTKNKNESKSYLVELQDVENVNPFVRYLGPEEVNKVVELGAFEVKPPFGTESLQLFASTASPDDLLPSTHYDGTYYVLGDSPKKSVEKSRGLVLKKSGENKQAEREVTESVLSFTTVQ